MSDIVRIKAELREAILSKRKAQQHDNDRLTQNLLKVVEEIQPKRVAIYESYPSEPNTRDFIKLSPVPVIVPLTQADGSLSWTLTDGTETSIQSGDLMFIPALAVDTLGNRLGRGKGYFDRQLEDNPAGVSVFAVVFDDEILDSVPTESHDRTVQGLVSEKRIVKIN